MLAISGGPAARGWALGIAIAGFVAGTITGITSSVAIAVGFSRRAQMAGALAKDCAMVLAEYRKTIRKGATDEDVSEVMMKLVAITAPIGNDLPYNEKADLKIYAEARSLANEELQNGHKEI